MTAERWLPVSGFEGLYEVSDLGRVRSLDGLIYRRNGVVENHRGRVLKPAKEKRGYLFVSLCSGGKRRHAKVHHLVAAAFLPPSDKPQINHKDFNKANNAWTNLEWATAKENTHHRLVAHPGLSAADASARMQGIYRARADAPRLIKPAGYHPKVKSCQICGALFTPAPSKRERQKTCSKECAGKQVWITRRAVVACTQQAA